MEKTYYTYKQTYILFGIISDIKMLKTKIYQPYRVGFELPSYFIGRLSYPQPHLNL